MHRLRPYVAQLRYWKPFQTGCDQDDDTAIVRELGGCSYAETVDAGVRLNAPLAPLFAARLEGKSVTIKDALDSLKEYEQAATEETLWIVEGAGGLLVPINDKEMMTDLMTELGLPVVVAVRSSLGTINHTLLTVEALRRRNLQIAGVVMVGNPSSDNQEAIERFGEVHVLGSMPFFEDLKPETLDQWAGTEMDRKGHLWELFR
jgi:malonyl-CoA O-methyltransferase